MKTDGSTGVDNTAFRAAVVMADISGSTPLYERAGNDVAAAAINARVSQMRTVTADHRGTFVSAKGDDVLCWFPSADDALDAAYEMTAIHDPYGLTVHAGVQWGPFLQHEGDIYGSCVNTAARLCALAKSDEILVGQDLYAVLAPERRALLVEMSPVRLKGVEAEMRIFSRQVERSGGGRTIITQMDSTRPAPTRIDARFHFNGSEWTLEDGQRLTIGRSDDNIIAIPAMSVSRQHATIALNNGLVEYTDHSSAGSVLRITGGQELAVFRRAVVLNGTGAIGLGAALNGEERPLLHFRVITVPD